MTGIRGLISSLRAKNKEPAGMWRTVFGPPLYSGTSTIDTALATSAVFACVRVIAETMASLPLRVYTLAELGGIKRVVTGGIADLIGDRPNSYQTRYEWIEQIVSHLCLRGNAYCFLQRDADTGEIEQIIPIHPDRVVPEVSGDSRSLKIIYRYMSPRGEQYELKSEDVWHAKGLSIDGFVGLSPISYAARAIGIARAADGHAEKYYENGAQTTGLVKCPMRLSEQARDRLSKTLKDVTSGDRAFSILVLEEGIAYEPIGISATDAQFLETRQYQIEEIARFFRVPCVLIGHADKTSTYASAEQFMLSFVTHTVRPWCARLEQSITRHLIGNEDMWAEFAIEGLLRGDTQSRYSAYASALQNKWMTRNEVRRLENLDPVPGGDDFENPAITTKTPAEGEQK